MKGTPFPSAPKDVVPLSIREFTVDLDMNDAPSLDVVCRRFASDTNRALVWFIRFRALTAWCARPDAAKWVESCSRPSREACEMAASFELNDDWEFNAQDFCSAVAVLVSRRPRNA